MNHVDWHLLELVNYEVNTMLTWVSDQDKWHMPDKWQTPQETMSSKTGDCEDYCILKAHLLMQKGIDPQLLRIAVVYKTDKDERHAVLLAPVEITTGILWWKKKMIRMFALDNNNERVLPMASTPYFVERLYDVERFVNVPA